MCNGQRPNVRRSTVQRSPRRSRQDDDNSNGTATGPQQPARSWPIEGPSRTSADPVRTWCRLLVDSIACIA
eukprot:gene19868-biopygen23517